MIIQRQVPPLASSFPLATQFDSGDTLIVGVDRDQAKFVFSIVLVPGLFWTKEQNHTHLSMHYHLLAGNRKQSHLCKSHHQSHHAHWISHYLLQRHYSHSHPMWMFLYVSLSFLHPVFSGCNSGYELDHLPF